MQTRADFINGMAADMHTWYWEGAESFYKDYQKMYPKLAVIKDIKDITGAYKKSTSAIGAMELDDLTDYGVAGEDRPQEGFSVYALKKAKAKVIHVPRIFNRDWHRTADFIKGYMKEHGAKMIEMTKEKIVASIYNYGGYTSGHAIFNQDSIDANLTTGYTNFIYDGKPFFALSGNEHTGADKVSTFYNALALTTSSGSGQANGVTLANAITMWNLLTTTNAKMENGRPFDLEQMGIRVLCAKPNTFDWDVINNSTLNPDNAENANNPLKGRFKEIIGSPFITTAAQSILFVKDAVTVWFGEPTFEFWETKNPNVFHGQIILDYAIAVKNFKLALSNNAPTA
jgi:hypothetical protein